MKITFLFNILCFKEEVVTLGKYGGASSHTWKIQEKMLKKPIQFWCIVLLTPCSHVYTLQSSGDVFIQEVVYRRSFQLWLTLLNQNYQSPLLEYNFN